MEWEEEPEGGSTAVEGTETGTERGVSTGLGTTGRGEEGERKEGSMDETRSKSDKAEVEGGSSLVEGGFESEAGGENQADKEEEKGI